VGAEVVVPSAGAPVIVVTLAGDTAAVLLAVSLAGSQSEDRAIAQMLKRANTRVIVYRIRIGTKLEKGRIDRTKVISCQLIEIYIFLLSSSFKKILDQSSIRCTGLALVTSRLFSPNDDAFLVEKRKLHGIEKLEFNFSCVDELVGDA